MPLLHAYLKTRMTVKMGWMQGIGRGIVLVDLKKHLILLIIKFSVESWNLMVFCIGNWLALDPIYQVESNSAE